MDNFERPVGILYCLKIAGMHRRRIKPEEKAKVVAVGWGTYLNAVLTI